MYKLIKTANQLTHMHNIAKKAIYNLSEKDQELSLEIYKIYDQIFDIRKRLLSKNNLTMRDIELFKTRRKNEN